MNFTLSEYNNNYSPRSDYEEENTQEIENESSLEPRVLIPNSHPRPDKYLQMNGELRSLLEIRKIMFNIFLRFLYIFF